MHKVIKEKIRSAQISNMFFNTICNALGAWLFLRSAAVVTFQGGESNYPMDLAATAFLLCFIIGLIVIPKVKRKAQKGDLPAMMWDRQQWSHRILSRFPRNTMLSALIFGLIGLSIVAPLTIIVLAVLQITQMDPLIYAIFKGFWAGGLAGIVTKPMMMMAVANAAPQPNDGAARSAVEGGISV